MTTLWRKAIRDFWLARARTALVVLAIALGISAFAAVLSSYTILTRELVYTGITRASAEFTLVTPNGSVLAEAVARRTHRASGLRHLIER